MGDIRESLPRVGTIPKNMGAWSAASGTPCSANPRRCYLLRSVCPEDSLPCQKDQSAAQPACSRVPVRRNRHPNLESNNLSASSQRRTSRRFLRTLQSSQATRGRIRHSSALPSHPHPSREERIPVALSEVPALLYGDETSPSHASNPASSGREPRSPAHPCRPGSRRRSEVHLAQAQSRKAASENPAPSP